MDQAIDVCMNAWKRSRYIGYDIAAKQTSNVGQALNDISQQTNCLKRHVRLLSLDSRTQLWNNLSRRWPQPRTEVMWGRRYQYVLSSVTSRGVNEWSWDIHRRMILLSPRLECSSEEYWTKSPQVSCIVLPLDGACADTSNSPAAWPPLSGLLCASYYDLA